MSTSLAGYSMVLKTTVKGLKYRTRLPSAPKKINKYPWQWITSIVIRGDQLSRRIGAAQKAREGVLIAGLVDPRCGKAHDCPSQCAKQSQAIDEKEIGAIVVADFDDPTSASNAQR